MKTLCLLCQAGTMQRREEWKIATRLMAQIWKWSTCYHSHPFVSDHMDIPSHIAQILEPRDWTNEELQTITTMRRSAQPPHITVLYLLRQRQQRHNQIITIHLMIEVSHPALRRIRHQEKAHNLHHKVFHHHRVRVTAPISHRLCSIMTEQDHRVCSRLGENR